MRRLTSVIVVLVLLGLISSFLTVQAEVTGEATGALRIEPHSSYYPLPVMLKSPATFNITAIDQKTVCNPTILLVMTDESYQYLTGAVKVEWTGGWIEFQIGEFTAVSDNSAYIPTNGVSEGARYHVSTLKSHIGVETDATLWYVYGPFLSEDIDQDPQEFTVTLPSTKPRMLVYALGKIGDDGCDDLNTRVPPTKPGFVVPDLAPILLAMASFSAFGLYAIKRRKK